MDASLSLRIIVIYKVLEEGTWPSFLPHSEFEKKIGSYIMGDGQIFVFLCIFLKGLGNLMLHKLFRLMQLVSCQQNLMWPLSNVH